MTQVSLRLVPDDADDDVAAIHRLTRQLRDRLRGVDVDEVNLVRADAAPGSKAGVGELVPGALVVLTTLRAGGLRAIVDALQAFLRRHDGRHVYLRIGDHELTVDGESAKDSSAKIDAVIRAVEQAAGGAEVER